MRADRVEISWDNQKSKWLVRIQSGEEVIRRHCDLARNADETALKQAALQTLKDEGYEADSSALSVQKAAS
ncbi:MAG TPA: hypothetical protein VHN74_19640 [Candidatus Angelobacter sp.]|jgi:hypothetical protein|nr:hypothetical protein [Candidatus Angelobacter sp.]